MITPKLLGWNSLTQTENVSILKAGDKTRTKMKKSFKSKLMHSGLSLTGMGSGLWLMIWSMDHPSAGEVRNIANPIELTGTPFPKPSAPPRLGEHTDDVLRDVLGFSADKIAALKDQGAV